MTGSGLLRTPDILIRGAISLSSLVPNVEDLLSLEVEEVAGVLLAYFGSFGGNSGNGVVSRGRISSYNFFNWLAQHPEYSTHQTEVSQALMEA